MAKLSARELELLENEEQIEFEKQKPLKMRDEVQHKKGGHHVPKPRFEPAPLNKGVKF